MWRMPFREKSTLSIERTILHGEFEGENEEFKNVVKRAQTTSDVVIVNEIPKRDALVLLKEGIKYFVKGR